MRPASKGKGLEMVSYCRIEFIKNHISVGSIASRHKMAEDEIQKLTKI